ncbi:hypothetical protein SKAU_G00046080 [Synaphobranchus kaupii]|uniref:Uncharacterized protein n=1 Tax=Synaphobranchus kaupii TaxID=118154 RepID=A0A9Q1J8Z3_SYNKA|nr:hypothetical protein SKAU_G00046080 [Synaphobranchus kaupii]
MESPNRPLPSTRNNRPQPSVKTAVCWCICCIHTDLNSVSFVFHTKTSQKTCVDCGRLAHSPPSASIHCKGHTEEMINTLSASFPAHHRL